MHLTISMVSTSAVAPETDYSWNTYNSAASFGLLFRGKEVLITKDTQFGLRDGSKGSARLILRGEPTKVMTITPEERTVLLARATPVATKGGKKAKVQGVVPAFDAGASWKTEVAPAIKVAFDRLSKVRGPSAELTYYMNRVAQAISSYADGAATAAKTKKVVAEIGNSIKITGKDVDTSTPMGQLAALLMNSSPEWKKLKSGKVKHTKPDDAFDAGLIFSAAATHMRLAQLMVGGRRAAVIKAIGDLDTSVRETIPSKVMNAIDRMRS